MDQSKRWSVGPAVHEWRTTTDCIFFGLYDHTSFFVLFFQLNIHVGWSIGVLNNLSMSGAQVNFITPCRPFCLIWSVIAYVLLR